MIKFELDLHNPKMHPYTVPNLNYMCATVQEIMNGNQLWNDGMTKGNTICPRHFMAQWRGP
jgi:hypothetical protein